MTGDSLLRLLHWRAFVLKSQISARISESQRERRISDRFEGRFQGSKSILMGASIDWKKERGENALPTLAVRCARCTLGV